MKTKLLKHGLRDTEGKYFAVYYSHREPEQRIDGKEAVTIYNREYGRFSDSIRSEFIVKNDTEIMNDYFEKDRIVLFSDHPRFAEAKARAIA